jgi:hypothetical protein
MTHQGRKARRMGLLTVRPGENTDACPRPVQMTMAEGVMAKQGMPRHWGKGKWREEEWSSCRVRLLWRIRGRAGAQYARLHVPESFHASAASSAVVLCPLRGRANHLGEMTAAAGDADQA